MKHGFVKVAAASPELRVADPKYNAQQIIAIIKAQADVEVKGLIVSLNRMEVGKGGEKCALDEIKDLYGFETSAIVTMEEVVEHLYNRPCAGKIVIDDTLKSAIDTYYEQYGAGR